MALSWISSQVWVLSRILNRNGVLFLAITLKYMGKDLWAQKTKGIQGDVPQVIFLSRCWERWHHAVLNSIWH